jgi:hypothetical protein
MTLSCKKFHRVCCWGDVCEACIWCRDLARSVPLVKSWCWSTCPSLWLGYYVCIGIGK